MRGLNRRLSIETISHAELSSVVERKSRLSFENLQNLRIRMPSAGGDTKQPLLDLLQFHVLNSLIIEEDKWISTIVPKLLSSLKSPSARELELKRYYFSRGDTKIDRGICFRHHRDTAGCCNCSKWTKGFPGQVGRPLSTNILVRILQAGDVRVL